MFSFFFQHENLYPRTTSYGTQQAVLQYPQDRYTCSTRTFVGHWRIFSRWTENDSGRSTLNMNLFIHLLQCCYRNDHKYATICSSMYETFTRNQCFLVLKIQITLAVLIKRVKTTLESHFFYPPLLDFIPQGPPLALTAPLQ